MKPKCNHIWSDIMVAAFVGEPPDTRPVGKVRVRACKREGCGAIDQESVREAVKAARARGMELYGVRSGAESEVV